MVFNVARLVDTFSGTVLMFQPSSALFDKIVSATEPQAAFRPQMTDHCTEPPRDLPLLGDHAASDAVASITRRIRFHVVGFGVDHERRPAVCEYRMVPIAQVHTWIRKCRLSRTLGADGEVRHVTGVRALWI